jgi:hypothetical protein
MPLGEPPAPAGSLRRKYALSDDERKLLDRLMGLAGGRQAADVGGLDPWAGNLTWPIGSHGSPPLTLPGAPAPAGSGGGGAPTGGMYGSSAPSGAVGRSQDPQGNWYWYGLGDVFNQGNPFYGGSNPGQQPAGNWKWDPSFGWRNDWDPSDPGHVFGED